MQTLRAWGEEIYGLIWGALGSKLKSIHGYLWVTLMWCSISMRNGGILSLLAMMQILWNMLINWSWLIWLTRAAFLTRNNKREGASFIARKLDRVMSNEYWMDCFGQTPVDFLAERDF